MPSMSTLTTPPVTSKPDAIEYPNANEDCASHQALHSTSHAIPTLGP